MNFTGRLGKSLNSIQVLEKYLISLLGLEKSSKYTTLSTPDTFCCKITLFYLAKFGSSLVYEPLKLKSNLINIVHEQYFISVPLFQMPFLYLRCHFKSYPVLMRKAVQNNVINDGHITVLGNTGDFRGLDES